MRPWDFFLIVVVVIDIDNFWEVSCKFSFNVYIYSQFLHFQVKLWLSG